MLINLSKFQSTPLHFIGKVFGNWSHCAISIGTVNVAGGALTKSNFSFGSITGNGLGEAPST